MYYLKETYSFSLTLPFKRRGHTGNLRFPLTLPSNHHSGSNRSSNSAIGVGVSGGITATQSEALSRGLSVIDTGP